MMSERQRAMLEGRCGERQQIGREVEVKVELGGTLRLPGCGSVSSVKKETKE